MLVSSLSNATVLVEIVQGSVFVHCLANANEPLLQNNCPLVHLFLPVLTARTATLGCVTGFAKAAVSDQISTNNTQPYYLSWY
jgi:hypothetical protein